LRAIFSNFVLFESFLGSSIANAAYWAASWKGWAGYLATVSVLVNNGAVVGGATGEAAQGAGSPDGAVAAVSVDCNQFFSCWVC